jgi:hypothetical protein
LQYSHQIKWKEISYNSFNLALICLFHSRHLFYSSLWWIIYALCFYLIDWLWFGLMVFNTTFNNILIISWRSFYWWRKPEYPEITTDLWQVTDKLDHIMLYQVGWYWFILSMFTFSVEMILYIGVYSSRQSVPCFYRDPGLLNELGSWIT